MKKEYLHFRLTENEKERLTNLAFAKGVSLSDYIRSKVMGIDYDQHDGHETAVDDTDRITIRLSFSKKDYDKICEMANEQSIPVPTFIRSRAVTNMKPADSSALRNYFLELSRQGNNLNQLVKNINRYRLRGYDPERVARVIKKQSSVLSMLTTLLEEYREEWKER